MTISSEPVDNLETNNLSPNDIINNVEASDIGDQEQMSSDLPTDEQKLRVLVVCHAYVTGVNQGKLDAIAKTHQADVALLVPNKWKSFGWGNIKTLDTPYSSIRLYSSSILFSGRVGAYFYWPWRVWQVIRDFNPDIIHVEQEVFSLSALEIAFFARWFKKPMSVFGWENMARELPVPRQWIRQFVFNTTQLIIPGNRDGEKIMRQWNYAGQLEVMPQIGVDTELFPHRPRELTKGKPFIVGFMGRLVKQKGVDLIFSAVRKLREKGINNIQIMICGSGVEAESLQADASEKGIADLVQWHSGLSHNQVPEAMDMFDVLVLPSRTIPSWKEQFGHVLIEAMSLGIPAIGSDSGEIPNVIDEPALVFPEDDAEALADILEKVSTNPDWYAAISRKCIDRVDSLYSHERIAQRLITLWRDICKTFSR